MPTGPPIRGRRSVDAPKFARIGSGVLRETFRRSRLSLRGVESWDDAIRALSRTRTRRPRTRETTPRVRRIVHEINRWHRHRFVSANARFVPGLFSLLHIGEDESSILRRSTERIITYFNRLPPVYKTNLLHRLRRLRGMNKPFSRRTLNAAILQSQTVARNRVQLIATDQTDTLVAELNEHRQRQVGVDFYEWRTVGDDRVRPTHMQQEGRIIRWDSPPLTTGHPGTEPNCRCSALPVHGAFSRPNR